MEDNKQKNMVEVVRCRDCIYYEDLKCLLAVDCLMTIQPDSYCSFARRKE